MKFSDVIKPANDLLYKGYSSNPLQFKIKTSGELLTRPFDLEANISDADNSNMKFTFTGTGDCKCKETFNIKANGNINYDYTSTKFGGD